MINKELLKIILDGRERRNTEISDCCEDIVKAARNRPKNLNYPGDIGAFESNNYNQSDYEI